MTDPVALLAELVRVPTFAPSGRERTLAELLARELGRRGADEVVLLDLPRDGGPDGASVFARWGTPTLLLNAHLDTVPPNSGWSADPLVLRTIGDRLVGLGAADTKGAIAAILGALDEVRPRDVGVLFSGDEEHGGDCMRQFLASAHARPVRRAVVCEPTGNRIGTRHRGILSLEATVEGEGGHSSLADTRPAPLVELARAAVAVHAWGVARREEGPPEFRGFCVNVARLDGGVAFNVVPDRAVLSVSLRPPPGADVAAVVRSIEAAIREACPSAKVRWLLENAPFQTRNLPEFLPFLGARPDAPLDLAFWTEAALLSAAGIDALVCGPGDIAQAHAPDEYVTRAQLDDAREAFVRVLRATAGERHGAG